MATTTLLPAPATRPPVQARPRSWFRRLVFLLVIDTLVLGGAEVLAGVLRPFYHHRVAAEEGLARPKDPAEKRIFLYGESTIYGVPYGPANSTARWLEAILKDVLPDQPVKVVNFGGPGQGSLHLRHALGETLAYQPDAVVLCLGHNEFLASPLAFVAAGDLHQWWYFHCHLYRIGFHALPTWRDRIGPGDGTAYLGIPPWSARHGDVMNCLRNNVEGMLAQADEHQIPMVLALPGCYLRWPPNQSQTPPQEGFDPNAFETRIQATKALVRRGVPGDGARLVKECPDHAAAHYWQARQLDQAGDLAAAAAEFQQALDLDCLPLRGQSSHGAVLQALAERHQVPYLDLRALFLHENGGRAPGGELFIDHCHPRPRGQYLMAREFARTLCDQGKLAPKERWHWDRLPTYAACLERIGLTAPQWRDAERKVIGGVFASAPEVAAELTAEPPPLANADDPEWRALNVLAEWKCGRPGPAEKLWAAQGGNLHAALAPVLRQWPSNVQADWARMIGALTPKAAD